FQAQVLSRLANGSYLIKVDNALANVKLPPGTKAGDTLELTLLATQPRPTFLLGRSEAGATASLSNAGRLIGNLLQLARQDGAPPTSLVGKTPLLADAGATAPQIAQALQHAMTFSGLFYESHVAQWANGTRTFTQLQSEPAAKRTDTPLPATPLPQDGKDAQANQAQQGLRSDLVRLAANLREWVGARPQATDAETRTIATLKEHALTAAIDSRDATSKTPDANGNEGIRLVSLQLDALEQRRILWQGQLFPGQPIEWEISDETPQRKSEEEPQPEAAWQSTVRFSLPTLGAVSATIRLVGEHVQVNVRTADADTAGTLRNYGSLLADALGAAGTTLDSLLVRHESEQASEPEPNHAPEHEREQQPRTE
ncbi:MAG TPA: flagellar hook-length control protein FliK, partial [Oxalicibacterium sp.]